MFFNLFVFILSLYHVYSESHPQCGASMRPLVNMHFADNALQHVSGSNCCHASTNPEPATMSDCCIRCSDNQDCDGWIWQPSSGKCWLVGALGSALVPFPTKDKVSGVIIRSRGTKSSSYVPKQIDSNPDNVILRNRYELPDLLNQQQPSGLGIILGVGNGTFAMHLLEKWPGGGLYLIDPYIHMFKGYDDVDNLSDRDHQIVYENLRTQIHKSGFDMRHTFIRDFSYTFATFWKSKTLPQPTFIYVDNNHAYKSVMLDLERWWGILAPGGLIAGSWYTGEAKRAVDDFFNDKRLHHRLYFSADSQGDPYPNWLIFKPQQEDDDVYKVSA